MGAQGCRVAGRPDCYTGFGFRNVLELVLEGALPREQNDEHAIQKRYMSLESLATMSGNPPIRLPAAPALA